MDGDVDSFFLPGGILDNDDDGRTLFINHSAATSQTRRLYSVDSGDSGSGAAEESEFNGSHKGPSSELMGVDLPISPRTALYSMSGTNPMAKEYHPPPQDRSASSDSMAAPLKTPTFPSWMPEEPTYSVQLDYDRMSGDSPYDAAFLDFPPANTRLATHTATAASEPIQSASSSNKSSAGKQAVHTSVWGTSAVAAVARSPPDPPGSTAPPGLLPVLDSRSAPPLGHALSTVQKKIPSTGKKPQNTTRTPKAEPLRPSQQVATSGKPPAGPKQAAAAAAASSTAWSTLPQGSALETSRKGSKVVMVGAKITDGSSGASTSTSTSTGTGTGGTTSRSDGRGRKVASKAAELSQPGEWLIASAGRGRSPGGRTAEDRRHHLRGPRFTSGVGPARKTTAESWCSEDLSLASSSSSSSSSESEREDETGSSRVQSASILDSSGGGNIGDRTSGRERGKREPNSKKDKSATQQQQQLRDRRSSKDDHHFKAYARTDSKQHDHHRSRMHSGGLQQAAGAGALSGSGVSETASIAAPGVGLVTLPLPHLPTSLPDLSVPRAAMGQTAEAARRAAGIAAREGALASRQAAGAARKRLGGLSGRLLRRFSKLLWCAWRLHVSCGQLLYQSWPVAACMALPLVVRTADWLGEAAWAPHWMAPCLVYSYLAQLLEPDRHCTPSPDDRKASHATSVCPTTVSSGSRPSPSTAALAVPLATSATTTPGSSSNITPPAAAITSSSHVHSSRRSSSSGNTASRSNEGASRGRSSSSSDSSAKVEKLANYTASSWTSVIDWRVRRFTSRILLSLALLFEGFADRSILLGLSNRHLLLLAILLAVSRKSHEHAYHIPFPYICLLSYMLFYTLDVVLWWVAFWAGL